MKTIPIALQAHYDSGTTTTCLLLRLECKDGTVLGFTSLDADLTYDDGNGPITYRADNGVSVDRLRQTADLNVDDTTISGWVSEVGIQEREIRAGKLDYARLRIYRVNYLDLSAGHEVIAVGTAGEPKYAAHGFKLEFSSLTQQLRQPITKFYSRTCRARFGSQYPGTGGEQPEERHPCTKPWVWVQSAVTAVSVSESDLEFTAASLLQADGYFEPGVVRWLTGANAGAQMEVDEFAGGVVRLVLPLAYPIAPGDTFEIRQDCDKTFAMCKSRFANVLHFRGEHLIPTDGGQSMVPGANIERA